MATRIREHGKTLFLSLAILSAAWVARAFAH